MSRLSALDLGFLLLESPSRPTHAGALVVFEPSAGQSGADLAERISTAFRSTRPVAPFDRRPLLNSPGLPRWETLEDIDLDYHVRRVALPAPGTPAELMELVGHLYAALLDRSRPLWECYVIEGLEHDRVAVLYKLHHALADGISGVRMLFGALNSSVEDAAINPIWAPRPDRGARQRRGGPGLLAQAKAQGQTLVDLSRRGVSAVPQALGLRESARSLPFSAPRVASTSAQQSSARSFAILDLPLSQVKQVATQAGGTVNDVVLSICDDAVQRYFAERGDQVGGPLVASMAVSTRAAGDESASNAAALAQVRLGAPGASPTERLAQVVASTKAVKKGIRGTSATALQFESLLFLGAAHLREELPIGRGLLPPAASLLISNIPGGASGPLFTGGARLAGAYAVPIVPAAHAANITLVTHDGALHFGFGAARNVIPDTARIAELARQSFEALVTGGPAQRQSSSVASPS